ncbi:hypothetical protein [Kitasatospora sp. NPDC057223]|uniref:hypothetical protein n=1 Tax=Kitasatospora sp. NPDC057223 TaxID=3346055 RepID=UPI00363238A2
MRDTRTWRLNPTDEMLYAAAGALGSSRVIQVLWRFPEPVSTAALEAEWHRLDRSRLSRRADGPAVPGARRRWVPANNEEPLFADRRPLTGQGAMAWIDAQVRVPLPAGSDALWRLAAAPYQGGSLLSLTVPHFRCDGLGAFEAIASRSSVSGIGRRSAGGDLGGDLADALGQAARAVTGSARWAARLLVRPPERARLAAALRGGRAPAPAGSAPRFFSSAIFDVDAALWEERARAHGGTVNSLFVEIAANLVRTAVPRERTAAVDVGVPMSLRRGAADGRANALVVVPLTLPGGARRDGGLHGTRRATKDLLRQSGAHSSTLVPEPLWHLLPARYADRLKAPGAQQTDVVASNFGQVPDAVARFAGRTADSVALRTMNVPGLVPERARLRASLCLLRTGGRMTVTATGIPDHFGDGPSLHRLVAEEFAAWGLTAHQWCGAPGTDLKEG